MEKIQTRFRRPDYLGALLAASLPEVEDVIYHEDIFITEVMKGANKQKKEKKKPKKDKKK